MKNQYPLGSNRNEVNSVNAEAKQAISANDISAGIIGDESINDRPSQVDGPARDEAVPYGEEEFEGADAKARFKDENKGNLLNDMRMI
jgi:hypothetical protein